MEYAQQVRPTTRGAAISVVLYLAALALVSLVARRASGVAAAQIGAGLALAAATVAPAWLIRNPTHPRRAVVTAGLILAAGLLLPALFTYDFARWSHQTLMGGSTSWFYMMLIAITPAAKSGWCASPRVLIGAAVVLAAATMVASVWL